MGIDELLIKRSEAIKELQRIVESDELSFREKQLACFDVLCENVHAVERHRLIAKLDALEDKKEKAHVDLRHT